MKERNQTLKKKTFERDDFTCQKCKVRDKTSKILEAHRLVPSCYGGKDELDNLITLCSDCHHFAPDKKEDFEGYMKEECDGTMTTFIKTVEKVRKEHSELFKKVGEKLGK
ncbi:MAG: HNH endonuclease [Candidatus Pacearchaeota archaeon]|nr:HNH endonuclease [Candidatus Pacearchaeota archaeon]